VCLFVVECPPQFVTVHASTKENPKETWLCSKGHLVSIFGWTPAVAHKASVRERQNGMFHGKKCRVHIEVQVQVLRPTVMLKSMALHLAHTDGQYALKWTA